MVKSAFLASAAGLVAMSGAQAADLPVKAKPVEYVKVCSLYGAGFYYIPGTDICMKVGGYVRYQYNENTGNSQSGGPSAGTGGYQNRTMMDRSQRARAIATFDTRQQTAYGTLRTYLLIGFSQDTTAAATTAPPLYATRAFIQIAGFTFGKATSFFDFVATAAVSYSGQSHAPDTGDAGQIVGAYTAQFGNGVSATIAIEQARVLNTVYVNVGTATPYTFAAVPVTYNLGAGAVAGVSSMPDVVGNVRIDQAWGSAQIAGAWHNVGGAYYGQFPAGAVANGVLEQNGHPGDKAGWAISPGIRLNAPMIGPGDYFQAAAVWTRGASKYLSQTPSGTNQLYFEGNNFGFGFWEDAIFSGTSNGLIADQNRYGNGLNLTTGFSVFASYEHFWTPSLRTSVYGSYVELQHNAAAKTAFCQVAAPLAANGATVANQGYLGCSPDWSQYVLGSRSQWNVTKDFYVGLDVIYSKLNSAAIGTTATGSGVFYTAAGLGGGKSPGVYSNSNVDSVTLIWRAHRDIVP
jgi:hypothetical protein